MPQHGGEAGGLVHRHRQRDQADHIAALLAEQNILLARCPAISPPSALVPGSRAGSFLGESRGFVDLRRQGPAAGAGIVGQSWALLVDTVGGLLGGKWPLAITARR
jgi:hypothetical protein